MSDRKKRSYRIKIEPNNNYPKYDKNKYTIFYKKNFGNWFGGCSHANSKEEILEMSVKTIIGMSNYDPILEKMPPDPTNKNIILTIGEIDLSISEEEILGHSLEKISQYRKIVFDDQETGGKILLEGSTEMIIYPKVKHWKCPIYLKQTHCCGPLCTTKCKYYSFHLKQNEFYDQRNKVLKFQQTLDYFFAEVAES